MQNVGIEVRRLLSSHRRLTLALLFVAASTWAAFSGFGAFRLANAIAAGAAPAQATDPGNPCPAGATTRTFDVSLINIPLFLNRFGDVVPEGRMYILDKNIAEARATFQDAANPFKPKDIIEPLTLRVNKGDCLEVHFTNRLNEAPPAFDRDKSIFTLPGEKLLPAGSPTPNPGEIAPSLNQPHSDFNPANAPSASIHFTGLSYDPRGSDGEAAGTNPNSTVKPAASITYRLYADQEGEFPFQDGADLTAHDAATGNQIGSNDFGAFGGVMVEKPGTTWVDVNDGTPLESGTRAIIKDPNGSDFRESVLYMHDEIEAEAGIITKLCNPPTPTPEGGCVNPTDAQLAKLHKGTLPVFGGGDADALVNDEAPINLSWLGFNYRSEPGFDREEVGCPALNTATSKYGAPACVGEETDLSSWPYGDPGGGDLVFHDYAGEPMEFRLIDAAEKETHAFHWHNVRWPFAPKEEGGIDIISKAGFHAKKSNILDVQAVSPGSHYSLAPEGGAGSPHDDIRPSMGDIIFHCHLYPHFAEGMLGLNRVHDVLEDGTRTLPDGEPVQKLIPLDDYAAPPAPTVDKPGFPFFIPGEFGHKAPKPPLGVPERTATGTFPPTTLEQNAAAADPAPGGYFKDPCPKTRSDGTPTPLKVFNVAAIQLDVTYNKKLGWHDPQQRIYVLQKDEQAVLNGTKKPEPFSPLINVGDCVVFHLRNDLPESFGGTVFDRLQTTNEVGIHQHLVQFDLQTSDGTANGWNYDQGADPGQTITYRDFASEDIRTNSFHDHFFPNVHQNNGLWGGSTVHPAGCDYFDRTTGAHIDDYVGTIVDVRCKPTTDYHGDPVNSKSYRSTALFVEDQVPMFRPATASDPASLVTPQGVPIQPPSFPSALGDNGVMGVNYSSEPFEGRRNSDPSNLFSSRVWGDPSTPLPMAYTGDKVRMDLFQLSNEESHGFNLDRFRWKYQPNNPNSPTVQAQHISMLETFDLNIPIDKQDANPDGVDQRDYLWNYGGSDDWFLGSWGLFRVLGCDIDENSLTGIGLGALYGQKTPLQQLPDNPVRTCTPSTKSMVRPLGNPCPTNSSGAITAPIKSFTIDAINYDLVYNGSGEHDPKGMIYVLDGDLKAVQAGTKKPEPLVIRVNQGDCVQITLKNLLDKTKSTQQACFEDLEPGQMGFYEEGESNFSLSYPQCLRSFPGNEHQVPGFQPFPISNRVSLNAKFMDFWTSSEGGNVGMNWDSTIGPGSSTMYRWYAPEEGMGLLRDLADPQTHLHRGLYGAIVVEPKGSTYQNPSNGTALTSGQSAIVVDPNGADFRDNVIFMNSDLDLFRTDGHAVADNRSLDPAGDHAADDPEDMGEFSIGYKNEPWMPRFASVPDTSLIFSSTVHGDPATPLFRAYAGDYVKFHVAQAEGDPRSTSFTLHGHHWRREPNDPDSNIVGLQGQFNPGSEYDVVLDPRTTGGAGGPAAIPGDYLYRSNTLFRHLIDGQWGLFRVFGTKQADLAQLPDHPVQ